MEIHLEMARTILVNLMHMCVWRSFWEALGEGKDNQDLIVICDGVVVLVFWLLVFVFSFFVFGFLHLVFGLCFLVFGCLCLVFGV